MAKNFEPCCWGNVFKIIAFVIALAWLFAELGWISAANVPWLPLIIVVFFLGKIIKHQMYHKK